MTLKARRHTCGNSHTPLAKTELNEEYSWRLGALSGVVWIQLATPKAAPTCASTRTISVGVRVVIVAMKPIV